MDFSQQIGKSTSTLLLLASLLTLDIKIRAFYDFIPLFSRRMPLVRILKGEQSKGVLNFPFGVFCAILHHCYYPLTCLFL